MIQIQPASARYHADHGWLQSNFSFSFADYYDPDNMQFGPMRVLNDDIVGPGKGFGMHPHREMEIVSLILSGSLEHRDSAGHRAVTAWGEIQRMSAGTGVLHSEMNPSETDPVSLLQMWFMPAEQGLKPSYETTKFDVNDLKNRLLPVVSHETQGAEGTIAKVHQDMTIFLSEPEAGRTVIFHQPEGRRIFLFVLEGEINVNNGTVLGKRDSARIEEIPDLTIFSENGARFMLIDLP